MSVPGINVLGLALSILGRQTVQYERNTGRTVNAAGRDTATFAAPVPVTGSFQPMPMATVAMLGIDLSKSWATFHAPVLTIEPTRGTSGDQLTFGGRRYQAQEVVNWYVQDGWTWSLWVDIGAANG